MFDDPFPAENAVPALEACLCAGVDGLRIRLASARSYAYISLNARSNHERASITFACGVALSSCAAVEFRGVIRGRFVTGRPASSSSSATGLAAAFSFPSILSLSIVSGTSHPADETGHAKGVLAVYVIQCLKVDKCKH